MEYLSLKIGALLKTIFKNRFLIYKKAQMDFIKDYTATTYYKKA